MFDIFHQFTNDIRTAARAGCRRLSRRSQRSSHEYHACEAIDRHAQLSQLRLVSAATLVGLAALGFLLVWSPMDFGAAIAREQLLEVIGNSVFDASPWSEQYFLYRDERSKNQWRGKHHKTARLIAPAMDQLPDRVDGEAMTDLRRNLGDHARRFLRIVDNAMILQTAGRDPAVHGKLDKHSRSVQNQWILNKKRYG